MLEALAMKIPILIRVIPIYENLLINRKQIYKGKKNDEFEILIRDIEGKVPKLIEEGYMKVKERSISKVGSVLNDVYQSLLISDAYNQKNEESDANTAVIIR